MLLSSTYGTDQRWNSSSRNALVRNGLFERVAVYENFLFERIRQRTVARLFPPQHLPAPASRLQRRWVATQLQAFRPDAVLVNYAMLAGWLPSGIHGSLPTIMEMHDFVSVNAVLRESVQHWLKADAERAPSLRDAQWFDAAVASRHDPIPMPWEVTCYSKFTLTIAISPVDAETLHRASSGCRVEVVQHSPSRELRRSDHSGLPLLVGSDNPFNTQGAIVFRDAILPLILESDPSFRFHVMGAVSSLFQTCEQAIPLGYVKQPEDDVFPKARLLIAPTFSGTGQQTKVLDCMAAGIPAVLFSDAAARLQLDDQKNALVADTVQSFAEACLVLQHDAPLLARLGNNALHHVARLRNIDYSTIVSSIA